jgi:glycopeptide antibiotics resistance protein
VVAVRGGRRGGVAIACLLLALAFVASVTIGARPNAVVKWSWRIAIESDGRLEYREARAMLELVLNVVLFVPLGVVLAVFVKRPTLAMAAAVGFGVSAGVELTQAAFLPDRTPELIDLVANTVGTMLGAAAVLAARALLRHRDTNRV